MVSVRQGGDGVVRQGGGVDHGGGVDYGGGVVSGGLMYDGVETGTNWIVLDDI